MNKYYLNNEGNPFAYASDFSEYRNGFAMTNSGNWMGLSHSGGLSTLAYSTSVSTEQSSTVSDSASLNLAVSVGASFAGFGASAGITTSISALKSKGISTAQVTTTATSGTVQNLSDDATEYNFDWQLIGWKTEPGDGLFSGVPFVGYAVRSVSAPPPCVTDLHVEYDGTPGRAYLCWNMPKILTGRIAVHNFDVYRVDNGSRQWLGNINCDKTGFAMFEVSSTSSPSASYVSGSQKRADRTVQYRLQRSARDIRHDKGSGQKADRGCLHRPYGLHQRSENSPRKRSGRGYQKGDRGSDRGL